MTTNKCDSCEFSAEKFYSHGSTIANLKDELAELRHELSEARRDIETFKEVRSTITATIKTLWALLGFIAFVTYDYLKFKFFK